VLSALIVERDGTVIGRPDRRIRRSPCDRHAVPSHARTKQPHAVRGDRTAAPPRWGSVMFHASSLCGCCEASVLAITATWDTHHTPHTSQQSFMTGERPGQAAPNSPEGLTCPHRGRARVSLPEWAAIITRRYRETRCVINAKRRVTRSTPMDSRRRDTAHQLQVSQTGEARYACGVGRYRFRRPRGCPALATVHGHCFSRTGMWDVAEYRTLASPVIPLPRGAAVPLRTVARRPRESR
jgi:hypothetical protein